MLCGCSVRERGLVGGEGDEHTLVPLGAGLWVEGLLEIVSSHDRIKIEAQFFGTFHDNSRYNSDLGQKWGEVASLVISSSSNTD
jgi:hypothetical protein